MEVDELRIERTLDMSVHVQQRDKLERYYIIESLISSYLKGIKPKVVFHAQKCRKMVVSTYEFRTALKLLIKNHEKIS